MSEPFEVFADKLCEYSMKAYNVPYLERRGAVQSYRAKVISKNTTAQTMVVQRPYDNQITLPYADSAAYLSAGDECLVLIFGESSNAIVVSDGKLSSLGVNTMVRPNLLDNWYFAGGGFPVNQRGETSYSGNNTMSVDRWVLRQSSTATTSVTLASGGLVFSGDSSGIASGGLTGINQPLDNKEMYAGQTVTISALVKNVTVSASNQLSLRLTSANRRTLHSYNHGSVYINGDGLVSRTLTVNAANVAAYSHLNFGFMLTTNQSASMTVVAVKMELGDTQTLAHLENGVWVLNELPNYQEQLARCQRHLYAMNTYGATDARFAMGQTVTGTTADFLIEPPVPMRTVPTLTTSGSLTVIRASNTYTATYAIDSTGSTNDRILVVATKDSSTWTTSNPCELKADSDATARLIFSAEL